MIVRTYGRRNRSELPSRSNYSSDPLEGDDGDDPFGFSPSYSQDEVLYPSSSQEFFFHSSAFPFSSQESSSFALDSCPFYPNSRTTNQPKRARISSSTTLLEAQESGEMMEHVDEVNFALDGLRARQPLRIRRASLLSLLTICATQQQRRLLRIQGLAKTIIDAVLSIGFDDEPCNLAAATLFYVLTGDGQDEYLLESAENIAFIIKFLEPIVSTNSEERSCKIGSKLLMLRKQGDGLRESNKLVDASSEALASKVEDLLITCKYLKGSHCERFELCGKWIALLTIEKACLSKISLEDFSGSVRSDGGVFKDKFRELGGLDAVFEVIRECLLVLEKLAEKSSWFIEKEDKSTFKSLKLLLKCLKIMENATFMNKRNQTHLLGLKGKTNYKELRLSFPEILINVVGILSEFCLKKVSSNSRLDFGAIAVREDVQEVICISSSEDYSSKKSLNASQNSNGDFSVCISSSLASEELRSSSCEHTSTSKMNIKKINQRSNSVASGLSEPFDVGEDPFAFDEDDYQPSKWDQNTRKKFCSRAGKNQRKSCEIKSASQRSLIGLNKLRVAEVCKQKSSAVFSQSNSISSLDDEEYNCTLFDCILSAVKVLMNLTNENPIGCQQIADCGVLETMSSLIARHFPIFTISVADKFDFHLNDQELDFLVAILGLLVNLVEKDGNNRSRLAGVTVSIDGNCKNIILLLCSIFLTNQGAGETSSDGNLLPSNDDSNDEAAMLQGEKEAEKMIVEAYSALLLAFLSTESKHIRESIANCLPDKNLAVLVPVLERFLAFHMTLNMISPETHKAVTQVIESCRDN